MLSIQKPGWQRAIAYSAFAWIMEGRATFFLNQMSLFLSVTALLWLNECVQRCVNTELGLLSNFGIQSRLSQYSLAFNQGNKTLSTVQTVKRVNWWFHQGCLSLNVETAKVQRRANVMKREVLSHCIKENAWQKVFPVFICCLWVTCLLWVVLIYLYKVGGIRTWWGWVETVQVTSQANFNLNHCHIPACNMA